MSSEGGMEACVIQTFTYTDIQPFIHWFHSFSQSFLMEAYGACPVGQDARESEQNQKQEFMVEQVRQTYTS